MSGEACVANIGASGIRLRRRFGWIALAAAVAFVALAIVFDLGRGWRLLLAIPVAFAALGFLQAKEQTCVANWAAGRRDADAGPLEIADSERPTIGRQVRRVLVWSLLITAVVTFAFLLI